MPTRTVLVGSASGLHARPAALFVGRGRRSSRCWSPSAAATGKPVPARSMLAVLSLGAKKGTEVTLEADGDGRRQAASTPWPTSSPATWTRRSRPMP